MELCEEGKTVVISYSVAFCAPEPLGESKAGMSKWTKMERIMHRDGVIFIDATGRWNYIRIYTTRMSTKCYFWTCVVTLRGRRAGETGTDVDEIEGETQFGVHCKL